MAFTIAMPGEKRHDHSKIRNPSRRTNSENAQWAPPPPSAPAGGTHRANIELGKDHWGQVNFETADRATREEKSSCGLREFRFWS